MPLIGRLGEDDVGRLTLDGYPVAGGVSQSGFLSITKSNIDANEEIRISKPDDPYYNSVVLSVQEYIDDNTTNITEVARVYNNAAVDSYEPNKNVSFENGLGLITQVTREMIQII